MAISIVYNWNKRKQLDTQAIVYINNIVITSIRIFVSQIVEYINNVAVTSIQCTVRVKELVNALKVAFLFIGTIIGAGFATGRELSLYFAKCNLITLILSALLMGGFCFLFLLSGKRGVGFGVKITKIVNIVLAVSAFLLYSAMLAAAEELIYSNYSIPLVGLFLGILSLMFASTMERLKFLNFVLIPFLIVAVILITKDADKTALGKVFNPINALAYCAMNMLFAAEIVQKAGQKMKTRDILFTSIIVAVVMFLLMYLMLQSIIGYREFSMPFMLVAVQSGKSGIGIVTILVAIITTMASCNKIAADQINRLVDNPIISYFAVLAMGMAVSIVGFAPLVNYTYPIISFLGVAICTQTLIKVIYHYKKTPIISKFPCQ